MKMYIELYASLMKYLPPGKSRFRREIEADSQQILSRLVEQFHITEQEAHIVLVNGRFVCGEDRNSHVLCEGDVVSIWPPVAGG
jgi:sulfur carrier protein ThiS